MDTLFFCLMLGGASLILIYGGIQIMRKYPRIRQPPEPRGFTEAEWIEIIRKNEAWCGQQIERERIQRQKICSDKSHWNGEGR